MDDELQQLEAELRQLRPVAPSQSLAARVQRDLVPRPARGATQLGYWLWATIVPAAAALAMLLAQSSQHPKATGSATASAPAARGATFKPIAAENVLVAAQDEGLVTLDDGTTARRARLKYVDTITWRDPRTNASLTWTVPREEVRVVPVVFQ